MTDRLAYLADSWETAAAGPNRQGAIHPTGRLDPAAYEASGRAAADRWTAGAQAHGLAPDPERSNLVLDFGCGDGRVARPLNRLGWAVLGVDVSASMVEAFHARTGGPLRAHLWAEHWPEIPAGPDEFTGLVDAVHSAAVWIHLGHDLGARTLARLVPHVRPGGLLGIDFPIYDEAHVADGWTDVNVWDPAAADAMVEAAGLEWVERATNPGRFSYEQPGAAHGSYQWLRRPA